MQFALSQLSSKAALLLAVLAFVIVLERQFPFAPVFARVGGMIKNLALGMINAGLSPIIVIPVTLLAAQWAPQWRPVGLANWGGLAIDVLILDFWIYWWHRANHMVPLLWRFHEVHHLDEHLDATTGLRFHFGEVVLSSLVRAAVVFVFAIPLGSVLVFEIMVFLAAVFQHSNIKLPPRIEGILSWLIVTPSIHWRHHHADRRDTDSSYATILSVWDRLFASQSDYRRTSHMQLGVENSHDVAIQNLLLKPFVMGRNP